MTGGGRFCVWSNLPFDPIKAIEKTEEIGDTWYLVTAGCGIRIQGITKHSAELIVP